VLVIGGSRLFHASIFWSAQIASKFVDIVHFASPANENNDLMRQRLKAGFWQGIVVDWRDVESYLQEDDVILIGPGMERGKKTATIVDRLLERYPQQKWVIDGGALQEVNVRLLTGQQIITPHQREMKILVKKIATYFPKLKSEHFSSDVAQLQIHLQPLLKRNVTILAKGLVDNVLSHQQTVSIKGGNAGLTKGGSGDILAGLVAALYTQVDAETACVVASLAVKKTAEKLWQTVGPNFNADDLIAQLPKTFWRMLALTKSN